MISSCVYSNQSSQVSGLAWLTTNLDDLHFISEMENKLVFKWER